ncbi:MAG: shikimate kinase [Oscillospiraceae bacterium]|nr:shikimate kinase [Oscillospiraceae bacterium]
MIKPIYLYGFMGCGKSHLARRSGLDYVDLDEFIGDIPQIFAEHGEQYFRELELSTLKEVNAPLVSLGGGALTNPETAKYAKENAVVVFIDTDFEVCYERIKGDSSQIRPLAVSKTKEELLALYNLRLPHYREIADYTIKGENEWLSIMQELKL